MLSESITYYEWDKTNAHKNFQLLPEQYGILYDCYNFAMLKNGNLLPDCSIILDTVFLALRTGNKLYNLKYI